MSVLNPNKAFAQGIVGNVVSKSTGVLANGTTNLFTIATGRVLVLGILGEVTTVIGSTASNAKLVYNPTAAGTSFDLCTAVAITSDAVKQSYHLAGNVGTVGALLVTGEVGQSNPIFALPLSLSPGVVEQNLSADPVGGVIQWLAWWVPIDDGATLVAA